MTATRSLIVRADDPWPEAVSDGLTSSCRWCGRVPVVDYRVTEGAWRQAVSPEDRTWVVCLECLVARAPWVAAHVVEVQVATREATTVFTDPLTYVWAGTGGTQACSL